MGGIGGRGRWCPNIHNTSPPSQYDVVEDKKAEYKTLKGCKADGGMYFYHSMKKEGSGGTGTVVHARGFPCRCAWCRAGEPCRYTQFGPKAGDHTPTWNQTHSAEETRVLREAEKKKRAERNGGNATQLLSAATAAAAANTAATTANADAPAAAAGATAETAAVAVASSSGGSSSSSSSSAVALGEGEINEMLARHGMAGVGK